MLVSKKLITLHAIDALFYLHAGFMVLGFLSMVTGASAAMFMRHKGWWFRFHKRAGYTGSLSILFGFTAALSMVTLMNEKHFGILHTYLGLATVVCAVVTPLLGIFQFKVKDQAARIRAIHRWSGRFTLLVAFVTVASGLLIIL